MPETVETQSACVLMEPSVFQDPYPTYGRLLREQPVYWSPHLQCWHFLRYQDVSEAFRDPRFSANRTAALSKRLPEAAREKIQPFMQVLSRWTLTMDPPDHTRLRSLINKAFLPRLVSNMESRIASLVDELIDAVREKGRMDVIGDLTYPLPAILIAELLGANTADREKFKRWSDEISGAMGSGFKDPALVSKGQEAILEMKDYFLRLLNERRLRPRQDLMSSLITAQEAKDSLNDEEILATCCLLLFAGHETTTNLIANGLLLLLRHPEEMIKLKRDPALIPSAIEECLRYESPVQRTLRIATTDMVVFGQAIQAGQPIYLMPGAANRDPAQFPDPDRFHVERRENPHLAFGAGIHYCTGAALGRLEGQVAIRKILERLPELRLVPEKVEWEENILFRGMKKMPVSF